jgi:hypothetical protein
MQILIFLSLFSFSNANENCLKDNKLKFPPETLSYYFSKKDDLRILPISQNNCRLSGNSIEIIDSKNRRVGVFSVTKQIRSQFNDIVRYQKDLAPELKSVFKNLNSKEDINPYKFFNFLYTFNNNQTLDFRREITFVIGKMTQLNYELVNFSHYRNDEDHWAAKSIDYKEAINLLSQPSKVDFVHIKNDDPYHLPVLSDRGEFKSYNNVHKDKYLDIVALSPLSLNLNKKPIAVFSKVLQYHQGYNTVTNLYLAGYRNIYWYHKSFMKWQAKYKYMEKEFYVGLQNALSNQQAESLLSSGKNIEILDISDSSVYNQVRFKKAKFGQVIFYDTEALEPVLQNKTGTTDDRRTAHGTYDILNAKELFPQPSTILIVTFNHYLNEYKAKEIHKRLEKLGHKVFILRTSTGVFLDYLRSKRSPLVNTIYEMQETSEVFSWKN